MDFLSNNRIVRIVNLCSRSLSNMWVGYGIEYYSFPWNEGDCSLIQPDDATTVMQIINVIEQTLEEGNSILVHSMYAMNRSVFAVACFLMKHLSWTSQRAMDFLLVKKPTIKLKPQFFEQMFLFEDILSKKFQMTLSKDWKGKPYNEEELTMTNTYLNTLAHKRSSPRGSVKEKEVNGDRRVVWSKKVKNIIPLRHISALEIMKRAANPEKKPDTSKEQEDSLLRGTKQDPKQMSTTTPNFFSSKTTFDVQNPQSKFPRKNQPLSRGNSLKTPSETTGTNHSDYPFDESQEGKKFVIREKGDISTKMNLKEKLTNIGIRIVQDDSGLGSNQNPPKSLRSEDERIQPRKNKSFGSSGKPIGMFKTREDQTDELISDLGDSKSLAVKIRSQNTTENFKNTQESSKRSPIRPNPKALTSGLDSQQLKQSKNTADTKKHIFSITSGSGFSRQKNRSVSRNVNSADKVAADPQKPAPVPLKGRLAGKAKALWSNPTVQPKGLVEQSRNSKERASSVRPGEPQSNHRPSTVREKEKDPRQESGGAGLGLIVSGKRNL